MKDLEDNQVYYKIPYCAMHHKDGINNWLSQHIVSIYEHDFRHELSLLEVYGSEIL